MSATLYRLLADLVVAMHFAWVAFVVVGLLLILVGILRRWQWVRGFWFRTIHLLTIGIVVFETLFGISCPLTDWEDRLRELAGETVASGTFIGRWTHWLLFYDVPSGSFAITYYVFGFAVLCVWFVAPPRWPWKKTVREGREGRDGKPSSAAVEDREQTEGAAKAPR